MHVLVFEPKYVGHYLGFATFAANAFARLGHRVTLALPRSAEGTPQAVVKLAALEDPVAVDFSLDVPLRHRKGANARFEPDALLEYGLASDCERLVVPSGDFLLSGLPRKRSLRRWIAGLRGADIVLHNCRQAYPCGVRQRIRLTRDRLAMDRARTTRIHSVDPYATRPGGRRLSLLGTRVHSLPHPYDRSPRPPKTQTSARGDLGLPADGLLIGSIGELGARKGTELLIQSFVASGADRSARLVLFGILSPSVKRELLAHRDLIDRGRIVVRDEFVSESAWLDFFPAMDVIWAGYPRHIGMASVLLHAAEAERPVLGSQNGCIGWMVRKYGLGRTAEPDVERMTRAVRDLSNDPAPAPEREAVEKLLALHSTRNFERHLTAAFPRRPRGRARTDTPWTS